MDAHERIRQLMAERGWSEYRLAKEAGISQSTVSNVFKRNTAPTLPTLEALCTGFGITMAQFFTEGSAPVALTEEQRRLLSCWSTLTEKQRESCLDFLNTVGHSSQSS